MMSDGGDGGGRAETAQPDRGAVWQRPLGGRLPAAAGYGPPPAGPPPAGTALTSGPVPQVEIVIPVHNGERALAVSVRRLAAFLRAGFPLRARITIAENGSTDRTWAAAEALAAELPEVRAIRLEQAGKGGAIKACWLRSDAEVLAFMDVDLSSGLNALLPLVAPLLSEHSDIAIGTRLARGARVSRGPRREIFSRIYNLLLHAFLDVGFSDAQCGFKAIRAEKARLLLPLTEETGFHFDTELLVLADRAGLRIHEVPVDWIDDPYSTVDVLACVHTHLRGVARLCWRIARGEFRCLAAGQQAHPTRTERGLPGQILRFGGIGVASMVAYVILYLMLRGPLSGQVANAAAMLVVAVANTAANRRFTFGIRGRAHAARHQIQGLAAFGTQLAVTAAALASLHAAVPRPSGAGEIAVLIAAGAFSTVVRFVLYRSWVFRPRQAPPEPLIVADGPAAAIFGGGPAGDEKCTMTIDSTFPALMGPELWKPGALQRAW